MFELNGAFIYKIAQRIFPIPRSLTGPGVEETLRVLSEYVPDLQVHHVPTGTQVFDWTVPKEWHIRGGYIADEAGNRLIDFAQNNLHIMGYSTPVDKWVGYEELCQVLYTQPDQPDVIPYVTSYYKERYGFCMSEQQKQGLDKNARYHIKIDSELIDGDLTYADSVLPGETEQEILIDTYVCHPSMANNECSGPALATALMLWLRTLPKRKYTYRFVLCPETIGAITYLSKNLEHLKKHLKAGFVLSCVGDDRDYSIIHSRYGNTLADRVLTNVLRYHAPGYTDYPYLKRGSNERQYNAPGVDLPVVGFCRSKYGEYPEYHTSADDMTLVSPQGFQGAFDVMCQVIKALEYNANYKIKVLCEPQLGKRGLYPTVSKKGSYDAVTAMVDLIAYADGQNDLIGISDIIGVPCTELFDVIEKLAASGLLESGEGPRERGDRQ